MTTEPDARTAGMPGVAGTTDAAQASGDPGTASLPATEIAGRVRSGELDPVDVQGLAEHWRGCGAFGPLARSVADAALTLDVLAGGERLRDAAVPSQPLRIASPPNPPKLLAVAAQLEQLLPQAAWAPAS